MGLEPPINSTNQAEWDAWFKGEAQAAAQAKRTHTRTLNADASVFQNTRTVKVNGVWKSVPMYSFGDVMVEATQEKQIDNKNNSDFNRKESRKARRKANRKKGLVK